MEKIIITIVAILITSLISAFALIAYTTDANVTFTVNDKERVTTGSVSKYLIYTDKGVYENTDAIWYWKWNSADVYNQIEVGKTYSARVYGFRIPFLSWFQNIIEVEPLQIAN